MKKSTVHIGLTNPKGPTNVGAVMRAAGCFNADKVYYSGERFARAIKFNTDTKNRVSTIPLSGKTCLLDDVPEGVAVVCVDLVEGAIPLPEFEHPTHAYYIFGPEDGTISQDVINRADTVVYIPTTGCLNLAATVNVVLYDRQAKTSEIVASDALILKSRDTNNRVKVKD